MIDLYVKNKLVKKDVELILFDKDGTLIDIHHYWGLMIGDRAEMIVNEWFNKDDRSEEIKCQLIDGMGIDLSTGRMKPTGPIGVKPRSYNAKVVRDIVISNGKKVTSRQIENIFTAVDRQSAKDLRPYLKILSNVINFIKHCQKNDVKLAIVSTDMTNRIKQAFTTLGLTEYFKCFVGADQVNNCKPAPDPALLAMDLCGTSPDNTVSIGDHPVDVKMGEAAGIKCNIALLTGLGFQSDFESLPCYIVESFASVEVRS